MSISAVVASPVMNIMPDPVTRISYLLRYVLFDDEFDRRIMVPENPETGFNQKLAAKPVLVLRAEGLLMDM